MIKKEANKKSILQPAPKVLVTCKDEQGNENALAVAYCGNCSFDPPMIMVGIVPSRYSHKIVKESKRFVVNLVKKEFAEEFEYLGTISGRDEDKLKKINANTEPGKIVNAPILKDCPVNIECTVVDSIVTGSHEMFIGKIEYVHGDENIVDEVGNIDFSKIELL